MIGAAVSRYHLIKNDLQTICSLLALETEVVPDGPARNALLEAQSRICCFGVFYKQMADFEARGETALFKVYIESLLRDMVHMFDSSRVVINLVVFPPSLIVKTDLITRCGLIINELISHIFRSVQDLTSLTIRVVSDQQGLCLSMEPCEIRKDSSIQIEVAEMISKQLGGHLCWVKDSAGRGQVQVLLPPSVVVPHAL